MSNKSKFFNKESGLSNTILELEEELDSVNRKLEKYSDYEELKLKVEKSNQSVEIANSILKDEGDKILALKSEIADKNNEINTLNKVIKEQGDKIDILKEKNLKNTALDNGDKKYIEVAQTFLNPSNIVGVSKITKKITGLSFEVYLGIPVNGAYTLTYLVSIVDKNLAKYELEIGKAHSEILERL